MKIKKISTSRKHFRFYTRTPSPSNLLITAFQFKAKRNKIWNGFHKQWMKYLPALWNRRVSSILKAIREYERNICLCYYLCSFLCHVNVCSSLKGYSVALHNQPMLWAWLWTECNLLLHDWLCRVVHGTCMGTWLHGYRFFLHANATMIVRWPSQTRRGVFFFLRNVLNFGIIISTRITLKQLFIAHIFKQ